MLLKKISLFFILTCIGIGLLACGDSDTGESDKPGSMTKSTVSKSAVSPGVASGTVDAYDPDVPSMVVEDNGVIHQEEIYKHWPTQDITAGSESVSADPAAGASMAMATGITVEDYDPDVPSMDVEDNGVISQQEIYRNWPAQAAVTSEASASTEPATEDKAPAAGAKTHTVFGQATSFSPNILFINPGDTVQWTNMTSHDSVSMEGLIPDGAEHWAFKIGQNGAVTLTEEGVYIYKCNPHYPLGMVAAIIVGKPVNIEQVQANATGRSKGIAIKVVKALATR